MFSSTRERSARVDKAIAAAGEASAPIAGAGSDKGRLLRWATWAVLSRVLTVQGPAPSGGLGGGAPVGRKLLIPFIDMFNHKAGTKHYLTGRTDGMLKVPLIPTLTLPLTRTPPVSLTRALSPPRTIAMTPNHSHDSEP